MSEKEEKGSSDDSHDWNIEEVTQEIPERKPPNDKIISFNIIKKKT